VRDGIVWVRDQQALVDRRRLCLPPRFAELTRQQIRHVTVGRVLLPGSLQLADRAFVTRPFDTVNHEAEEGVPKHFHLSLAQPQRRPQRQQGHEPHRRDDPLDRSQVQPEHGQPPERNPSVPLQSEQRHGQQRDVQTQGQRPARFRAQKLLDVMAHERSVAQEHAHREYREHRESREE
jgi:hypothetical protein